MSLRAYTPFILAIIVIVAVLGMPIVMGSPIHHEMGCPFIPDSTAMCATSILGHVSHWQSAFATILFELVALAALALVALRQWQVVILPDRSFERVRTRRLLDRPTLLQELFSRGILNPKTF